ncbi:MAG: TonB-dependent receptor [Calditrichaeota bacterium]|nr:TonB-dependent receptor [Calditrichota bacterium]
MNLFMRAFLLSLFICLNNAIAQIPGKISGFVSDSLSGEPLPGAEITVENTSYSATTDIDGHFVLLNMPVGMYNIRSNFIGYRSKIFSDVRVFSGTTTEVDFMLSDNGIAAQHPVVIKHNALVNRHIVSTALIVTSKEFANLPVRGFDQIISLQNSVVLQDGELHIRGGRGDEIGFYIDGAYSADPLTNTQTLHVIQEAVEEFRVQSGGISAEYGNATSGVVLTHLKTGGDRLKYTLDYRTDNFAAEGQQSLGTYSYQHYNGVFTVGGPLFYDNVRFFLAGEHAHKGDRHVRFSKGFDLVEINGGPLPDRQFNNVNRDTIETYKYPAGFTPGQSENVWAMQGTMLFDYQPVQLHLSASWSDRSQQFNSGINPLTPMLDVLNDRYSDETHRALLLSAKLSYAINPSAFAEVFYRYYNSTFDTEDSYLGNDWMKWYDSLAVTNATNGEVNYASRYRPQWAHRFNGWDFARNGDPYNNYTQRNQNYREFGLRFTSQIGAHHEIRFGGNYRSHLMRQFEITPSVLTLFEEYNTTDIKEIDQRRWISWGRLNNYGYDIYGAQSDIDKFSNGNQIAEVPKKPVFASFFVQDKIEYSKITLNAGLRYDYFDTKGKQFKDPQEPEFDLYTTSFTANTFENLASYQYFSPRLSISFLAKPSSLLFANFGKFVQTAGLETIYAGNNRFSRDYLFGGNFIQNPFGLGVKPVQSQVFELGFCQGLSPNATMQITGFYRTTDDLVSVIRRRTENGMIFSSLVNDDAAETYGFDFNISTQRVKNLQAMLNYTFSNVRGSGSERNSHIKEVEFNITIPTDFHPLAYQQKHRGSVILDYRFGDREGGLIFNNFGVNAVYTFNSGHPYTFSSVSPSGSANVYNYGVGYLLDARSRNYLEPVGASQTPNFQNFDLRMDKTFNLKNHIWVTIYAQINNFFNTQNVINVYPGTGNARDDGFYMDRSISAREHFLNDYGEAWLAQHKAINIENGQAFWDVTGTELYGHPRQIFFGIKLSR